MEEYRSLLSEHAKHSVIRLTTLFEDVREKLRKDSRYLSQLELFTPRYEVVDRDERRSLFDEFQKDLKQNILERFEELMQESRNIGHITSNSVTSGSRFDSLKALLQVSFNFMTYFSMILVGELWMRFQRKEKDF